MTLYKIFKENEEKVSNLVRQSHSSEKDFKHLDKWNQLALIDGFIAMVEEMERHYVTQPHELRGSDTNVWRDGYNWFQRDLKDKLLADRKLIEENK